MAFVSAHGIRREISLERILAADRQPVGRFGENIVKRIAVLGDNFGAAGDNQFFRQPLKPNILDDVAVDIDSVLRSAGHGSTVDSK